jgi:hypothetical protein
MKEIDSVDPRSEDCMYRTLKMMDQLGLHPEKNTGTVCMQTVTRKANRSLVAQTLLRLNLNKALSNYNTLQQKRVRCLPNPVHPPPPY